ncbi:hypothetical protein U8Q02_42795 (plasmid) [Rhizobium leguminosarum]|nr:hypothetical protein U8Q02_42795 [Rhizobium leguminosarum]
MRMPALLGDHVVNVGGPVAVAVFDDHDNVGLDGAQRRVEAWGRGLFILGGVLVGHLSFSLLLKVKR